MIARPDARPPVESAFTPALLLVSGRALGFVAAFGIPLVLVRIFDQSDFGTYKQLFLIAATLYTVGQLGMAESLFYFLPQARRADGARYVVNAVLALVVGGAACAALLGLSRGAVSRWLSNADLARHMTLLGLYLVFMLASAALEIVMIARKRFAWASWSYAVLDLLRAGFIVVPALLVPQLEWLLLGAVGFAALRCALAMGYLWWDFRGGLRPDGHLLKSQLAYAVPFQLSAIVEIVQSNLHQYVVAHHFDPATFAIYAVGCLQIPLVEVVFVSVVNVMMVRMTEELRDGRGWAALVIWHDSTRKLALVFFPLAVLLVVAARQVIVVLFTESYAASTPVFMVSSLALFLAPLAVDGALRVYAQTRLLVALNLVRLVLIVALLDWFLGAFHLVGPLLVTLLAAGVMKGAAMVRIRQLMGVGVAEILPWRSLATILAAAAAAAAPALIVKWELDLPTLPLLLATGTVYGLTYVGLIHRLRLLSDAERLELREWVERRVPPLARALAAARVERG